MIQDFITIEQGVLLLVTKGFWTSGDKQDHGFRCKKYIPKGEVLEIRYPYAWHFRTANNMYDHAKTEVLTKHCDFFGVIHKDVKWNNKHELKQILEENLYHKPSEYKLALKENR